MDIRMAGIILTFEDDKRLLFCQKWPAEVCMQGALLFFEK